MTSSETSKETKSNNNKDIRFVSIIGKKTKPGEIVLDEPQYDCDKRTELLLNRARKSGSFLDDDDSED